MGVRVVVLMLSPPLETARWKADEGYQFEVWTDSATRELGVRFGQKADAAFYARTAQILDAGPAVVGSVDTSGSVDAFFLLGALATSAVAPSVAILENVVSAMLFWLFFRPSITTAPPAPSSSRASSRSEMFNSFRRRFGQL